MRLLIDKVRYICMSCGGGAQLVPWWCERGAVEVLS